jgi:hypothetical protein
MFPFKPFETWLGRGDFPATPSPKDFVESQLAESLN